MAEQLNILEQVSREEQYCNLLPQINALIMSESDLIANLANISAVLKEAFNFLWVGFYFVKGDQLVLGPFQGHIACTRIRYGRGVCGTAWKENRNILVENVDNFPGHITCDSKSRSEVVLPIRQDGSVIAILDIDSEFENHFTEIDVKYLAEIVSLLSEKHTSTK